MVNAPEQPTKKPDVEDAPPVKEAVVEEAAPVKEEPSVKGPSILEEPTLTPESEPKTISPAELAESLVELKDRVKAAGILPLQNVITSYASTILGAVDGLLGALEGKKKKDK